MKHISSFSKMGLNFFPMRFDNSEKESFYRSSYDRKSFHFLIVALLVNIALFVLLLFSEKDYSHEIRNFFWFADLVFIALFAVIIFVSLAFRSIRKSFFMRFPVFIAAITVILLKVWYISKDPVLFQNKGLEYSSMFFLMILLLYLLSRLRFIWSTVLGISMTAIYLWLLNNNNLNESLHFPSVLFGLNVIGIFSNYYLEFLSRKHFHMEIEAESNQDTIIKLKDERNDISMEFERISIDLNKALSIIGKIVEMRDMNTAGHQRKVAKLSVALAEKLDIPSKKIPIIFTAALLHDIGKIEIPADILTKPGRLSEPELGIIRRQGNWISAIERNTIHSRSRRNYSTTS
ncbi:hypothetical protein AT15_08145 [Kosmotoga arenicorallina S304]|uniref:HD-GYP domain-containing protein n=1 Tax=Kosmotoga arenicorallina S304 TaxID=1453497 RepID=A0A182C7F1_9BACT|nr:HD domain-containing phosphohydrolase [Kosmotoga arenicorallina]OAA31454.1 hypothetical protein AT15_08145 [Kosmotoga arenicorallina S304]